MVFFHDSTKCYTYRLIAHVQNVMEAWLASAFMLLALLAHERNSEH